MTAGFSISIALPGSFCLHDDSDNDGDIPVTCSTFLTAKFPVRLFSFAYFCVTFVRQLNTSVTENQPIKTTHQLTRLNNFQTLALF